MSGRLPVKKKDDYRYEWREFEWPTQVIFNHYVILISGACAYSYNYFIRVGFIILWYQYTQAIPTSYVLCTYLSMSVSIYVYFCLST